MATLHRIELPHGLFPRLGRNFIRRWHGTHRPSPYGIALVAVRDDQIIGFLLGTTDHRRHVGWVLDHARGRLAVQGILALMLRPVVLAHFVRTRAPRYLRRLTRPLTARGVSGPSAGLRHPPVAVLEAVAVLPAHRGQGIGGALVNCYLRAVRQAGGAPVELVTKAGRDGAAGFYERFGWQHVGEHTDRDGDHVLTYRIDPRSLDDSP